jgi:hypothetical protein
MPFGNAAASCGIGLPGFNNIFQQIFQARITVPPPPPAAPLAWPVSQVTPR